MYSFYKIIFYSINFFFYSQPIISLLVLNLVSNLDPIFIIFALSFFNNYFATLAKYLGDTIINIYRNMMISVLIVSL